MIQRVVSWALSFVAKEAGNGGAAAARFEEFVPEVADLARRAGILGSTASSGVTVEPMPACLAALGRRVELVPQPVFQPDLDALLFVAGSDAPDPSGWDDARVRLLTAVYAAPGLLEVNRRAAGIEPQTRRAVRMLFGDRAFSRGWSLYAASLLATHDDSLVMQLTGMAQLLGAAADLVVDVEMHSGSMDEKTAEKLLVEQALVPEDEARVRVLRARLEPTALAAPYLGYQGWLAAREVAREKLKKGFSAKGFHERALDLGPVPMDKLAELIASDDPDAEPDYVGVAEPTPEGEKTTFSFIDAF
jgi:hypothetical protein